MPPSWPRRRTTEPARPARPVRPQETVLASATLITRDQIKKVAGKRSNWQKDAWDFYDTIPELRSGVSWRANACSRARLYAGRIDRDGGSEPTPIDAPRTDGHNPAPDTDEPDANADLLLAPVAELAGGQLGQSEMLRRMSTQLDVVGDCSLIGFDDPGTGRRRWIVASLDELTSSGSATKLALPETDDKIDLDPDSSVIMRIWHPHPRRAYDADSPVRALSGVLRELLDLSAHITASAESRLAGSGILKIPDGVSPPTPEQGEDGPNPVHANPFIAALIEAASASLKNRDSASALVPLILSGDIEALKGMEHLTWATPLDENANLLREAAIKRLATGLDMPAEQLTGMGDVNHWGQWAIQDEGIKLHIEPMLGLICDALTEHYYRPALTALAESSNVSLDPSEYAIWYDTADLKLRPNRSPEAAEAYGKGIISADTYRRELGFADEDAPEQAERARYIAEQVALTNANLAPVILPILGVDAPGMAEARPQGTPAPLSGPANPANLVTNRAKPQLAPAADGGTGRNNPPAQAASAAPSQEWRTSCLDMAVTRALERAGHQIIKHHTGLQGRSVRASLTDVPPHEVHVHLAAPADSIDTLLAGAYREFITATPDEPCLHDAVDGYVRALIMAREPHQRGYLDRAIAQFGCDGQAA